MEQQLDDIVSSVSSYFSSLGKALYEPPEQKTIIKNPQPNNPQPKSPQPNNPQPNNPQPNNSQPKKPESINDDWIIVDESQQSPPLLQEPSSPPSPLGSFTAAFSNLNTNFNKINQSITNISSSIQRNVNQNAPSEKQANLPTLEKKSSEKITKTPPTNQKVAPKETYFFPSNPFKQDVEGDDPCTFLVRTFDDIFSIIKINIDDLRWITWSQGIPQNYRCTCWKMMLGYYTAWPHSNGVISEHKLNFYIKYSKQHLGSGSIPPKILAKIRGESALTGARIPLFQSIELQDIIERATFVAYKESLEDNYMTGMSQLALPFLYIIITNAHSISGFDPKTLTEGQLQKIESDLFWEILCFSQHLGVKECLGNPIKSINKIEESLKVIDESLYNLLVDKEVEFTTITYEWTITLLFNVIQKMPLIVLLWDKYVCLADVFLDFHACVCASLISYFKPKILELSEAPPIIEYFKRLSFQDWNYVEMQRFTLFIIKNAEILNLPDKAKAIIQEKEKLRKQPRPPKKEEETTIAKTEEKKDKKEKKNFNSKDKSRDED